MKIASGESGLQVHVRNQLYVYDIHVCIWISLYIEIPYVLLYGSCFRQQSAQHDPLLGRHVIDHI